MLIFQIVFKSTKQWLDMILVYLKVRVCLPFILTGKTIPFFVRYSLDISMQKLIKAVHYHQLGIIQAACLYIEMYFEQHFPSLSISYIISKQQQQVMGNYSVLNTVQQAPVATKNKPHLTVATLNYCGIAYSPFQFYFKDYEKEIATISKIFRKFVAKYVNKFDEKTFKWDMGKIDKTFKKGRYSNMFYADVGIFWKSLLTKEQFQKKWEIEFKKHAASFKFEWKQAEKNTVKLYDFIMYHTLLEFAFGTQSFEQAIKNSAEAFRAKIQPLYQLSFLDEQLKLKKFLQGFHKLEPDVFFIQEYSNLLLTELKKSNQYIVTDPKEDSLVLFNKKSFTKFQDFSEISKEINEEQKKGFRWAESIAFAGADNYIFACVHLSSNQQKNKVQIQNLKADLLKLKEYLPKYEIVVGGDLNSYLKPQQKFTSKFHVFPRYQYQFTTLKKRTYSQAQFHKAEKEIKQSKDKIISTKNIEFGQVRYLPGGKADDTTYLPSHDHPYDHLLCYVLIPK